MTNPYSPPSVSGYNTSPPSDDWSVTSTNRVSWATIKTKLADPLLNMANAINTAITNAFGILFLNAVNSQSSNYTVQSSDRGKLINLSNGATGNLLAAATAGSGFAVSFKNVGSSASSIAPNGTDNIDGNNASISINPGESVTLVSDGTGWWTATNPTTVKVANLRGFLNGFECGAPGGATTLTIGPGACLDSANAAFLSLTSTYTKTMANWAVGSGNGGLDTGSIAGSTPYFVWAIKRPDTGVSDILISTSGTAPTMPANYTLKRLIGWFKTDATPNILQFQQRGDDFIFGTMVLDVNNSNIPASPTLYTVTGPSGFVFESLIRAELQNTAANMTVLVLSPDETTQTPGLTGGGATLLVQGQITNTAATVAVRTNTSSQVKVTSSLAGNASTAFFILTYGFRWSRGRNS